MKEVAPDYDPIQGFRALASLKHECLEAELHSQPGPIQGFRALASLKLY